MSSEDLDLRSKIPIIVIDYFMMLMIFIQAINVLYHFVLAFMDLLTATTRRSLTSAGMLQLASVVITTMFTILFILFVYLPERAVTPALLTRNTAFRRAIIALMMLFAFVMLFLALMTLNWESFWIISFFTVIGQVIVTILTAVLRTKGMFSRKSLSIIIRAHVGLFLRLLGR